MRKAATTEEYNEQWNRFEAAKKKFWYRLRRHGWRIERTDPSILWYRSNEVINVWFDWLDMEVEIERGLWASVLVEGNLALRKIFPKKIRVSFEDFESGNFSI